jgi:hypothetical protein
LDWVFRFGVIISLRGGAGSFLRHQRTDKRAAKSSHLGSNWPDIGAIHTQRNGTEPDQA